MSQYIMRLDDACPKRDINKWNRIEAILDKYNIKPLVGIIPDCKDPAMQMYENDEKFWDRVVDWRQKGWVIAMHGYDHVYKSTEGGVNPVNKRSEFAGISLVQQKEKISKGIAILKEKGIEAKVFFAPSHTFDDNTIEAIKSCSEIRIISDTIANKIYGDRGITFVPQQSGKVRKLPFHTVTFCYHPNNMKDASFDELERFLIKNQTKFISFPLDNSNRKLNFYDKLLRKLYFLRR